jgi:hypothetical protein
LWFLGSYISGIKPDINMMRITAYILTTRHPKFIIFVVSNSLHSMKLGIGGKKKLEAWASCNSVNLSKDRACDSVTVTMHDTSLIYNYLWHCVTSHAEGEKRVCSTLLTAINAHSFASLSTLLKFCHQIFVYFTL